MVRILFFIAFCLAAAPLVAQGRLISAQTGLTGGHSEEVAVSQHRHFAVYAQAQVVQRGNQTVYSVFLRHGLNDGSRLHIDEAWYAGQRLAFDPVPPDRVCGGLRCLYNVGVLSFSRANFQQLGRTGIYIRLVGSQGPIDLRIPGRLFAQASAEAAALTF